MFSDIQTLLPKTLKRSGLGKQMVETRVVEAFDRFCCEAIAGDLVASFQAMYLSGNILMVASLSPYATEELKRKESYIVRYINEQLGENAVRKLGYLT